METQSIQIDPTPLCIDLDGTLVKLDTLHQAVCLLVRRNPTALLSLPRWIRQGRAFTKNEVAKRIALHAEHLPYNTPLLDYLRAEKKAGRRIILVTAANYRTAEAVASHIGLFDDVLASTAKHNLFSEAKRDALVQRFTTFDYAGDSISDLPVWQAARQKILVNPSHQARKAQPADLLIEDRRPLHRTLPRMLRLHHWVKNLLIFSPLLLAHRINETSALNQSLLAFVAFSLIASAIYIINDLLDLSADQTHPRKKHRPFAAGDLQLIQGVRLIPMLLLGAFLISSFLPFTFSAILLLYLLPHHPLFPLAKKTFCLGCAYVDGALYPPDYCRRRCHPYARIQMVAGLLDSLLSHACTRKALHRIKRIEYQRYHQHLTSRTPVSTDSLLHPLPNRNNSCRREWPHFNRLSFKR